MLQSVGTFTFPADRLILPDVCCDVSVVDGRAYFSGAMTRARLARHVGREVLLLRIGIASARDWLRIPLAELTDLIVPLADLDRRLTFDVERHLDGARRSMVAEPTVGSLDPRFRAAARALVDGAAVGSAAARVAVTERQLERIFHDRVGVTPKLFARITRFRRALFAARAGAPFAAVAAECGYADQAHFTRDVQALTGQSPRALLPRTGDVGFVQDPQKWRDVGCE